LRVKAFRLVLLLLVVSGFLGVMTGAASAAPGDLDRFFGRKGTAVVEALPGPGVSADDMVVGPGNAIYVLREETRCDTPNCSFDFVVSRHDADGALDASYGVAGFARVLGSSGYVQTNEQSSLAVTSSGKVVVAATDRGAIILARLNGNGSLDGSFGIGGVARFPFGIFVSRTHVAIDDDGKIVVGAESAPAYGETKVVVSRYTPQGALDPTFNGGAPVITGLGSGLGGFGLTRDSKVVLAGPRCCRPTNSTVHVGLLTDGGVFDRQFGVRGHRFVDDVAHGAQVGAVLALPGGKVDVVGAGGKGGVVFALRLLAGGRLDPTFGNHGIAYVKHANFNVAGAAIDEQGRLIIAGSSPRKSSFYGGDTALAVVRRLANGRPDRIFGGGGVVRPDLNGATHVSAIDLQSGGRIVGLVEVGPCSRSCPPSIGALIRLRGGSSGVRCMGKRANIVGTRSADHLVGTPRRDVIAGLGGDDTIRGRGGNDLICGGRGNDEMAGGPGRDRLAGGPGRDRSVQ
jgi:uncharacterized delta-60 repeat protein